MKKIKLLMIKTAVTAAIAVAGMLWLGCSVHADDIVLCDCSSVGGACEAGGACSSADGYEECGCV